MIGENFKQLVQSTWQNRRLIIQMIRREVVGRYQGSFFGLLWSFFNPLLMLAVYTFVFSYVFKTRWANAATDSKTEFALILFAGLIIHNLFSECISRAPGLILTNVNFVKKVVFPLEILPWTIVGSSLFHASISFLALGVFYVFNNGMLHWTVIYLPMLLVPLILMITGFSWFLASLGVYLRDVGQTIGILMMVLMFMSPIFYPLSALPEAWRKLLLYSPTAFMIEQTREIIIWGHSPNWTGYLIYSLVSITILWLGYVWFQKTRRGFADVL